MSSCRIRNTGGCISIDDHKKLNSDICICYKGIAFDGCNFYATIPNLRTIATFSRGLSRTGMIDVPQRYEFITYDSTENVFWATVDGDNNTIYKLDRSFNVISTISLPTLNGCCVDLQGLSYCCCSNTLLVLRNGVMYQVEKDGTITELSSMVNSCECERIVKVLCLAPYYVVVIRKRGRDYIKAFSCTNCDRICIKKLPRRVRILDLVTFRRRCSGKVILYAIATKNGTCNYIFEIELKHLNPAACNFLNCCGCNNNCSLNNNTCGCGCNCGNGCGCNGICPTIGGASENSCYYNNCTPATPELPLNNESNTLSTSTCPYRD